MSYDMLVGTCTDHFDRGFPFVIYMLPNTNEVVGHFQNDSTLHTLDTAQGETFVFAPFQSEKPKICIPFSSSEVIRSECVASESSFQTVRYSEESEVKSVHIDLIKKTIAKIQRKETSKVVVSRKAELPLTSIDFSRLMDGIFKRYPLAFRYIWFHPETGLWCGATPEVLMQADEKTFETMSLAGTRGYVPGNEPVWSQKEKHEQQLVTDYISDRLQKVTKVLKVSSPYNHRAGSLFHLRTDIQGVLKKSNAKGLMHLADLLHPTPAVCGIPMKEAQKFIIENEGYDREYYTGYLGFLGKENMTSQLYVNLRCMKIENNTASIYVGGGITSDSNPEDEWVETQNKLQTMLRVVWPLVDQ